MDIEELRVATLSDGMLFEEAKRGNVLVTPDLFKRLSWYQGCSALQMLRSLICSAHRKVATDGRWAACAVSYWEDDLEEYGGTYPGMRFSEAVLFKQGTRPKENCRTGYNKLCEEYGKDPVEVRLPENGILLYEASASELLHDGGRMFVPANDGLRDFRQPGKAELDEALRSAVYGDE